MKRFEVTKTALEGLYRIKRLPIVDQRGFLERLFCADELGEIRKGKLVYQVNHTLTKREGSVRGMHFQKQPFADSKLVLCLRGRVFDVAVDIREHSPTFLSWYGACLGPEDGLFIGEGFAHGFQTLEEDSELIYFHGAPYSPSHEGALHPKDARIGVEWPLPISEMSERDNSHPMINPHFRGIQV